MDTMSNFSSQNVIEMKSHTCEEGGHTSEFLFGIYWCTWKTTIYQKSAKVGQ